MQWSLSSTRIVSAEIRLNPSECVAFPVLYYACTQPVATFPALERRPPVCKAYTLDLLRPGSCSSLSGQTVEEVGEWTGAVALGLAGGVGGVLTLRRQVRNSHVVEVGGQALTGAQDVERLTNLVRVEHHGRTCRRKAGRGLLYTLRPERARCFAPDLVQQKLCKTRMRCMLPDSVPSINGAGSRRSGAVFSYLISTQKRYSYLQLACVLSLSDFRTQKKNLSLAYGSK